MFKDHSATTRLNPPQPWRGVRLTRLEIGPDPDAPPEPVIVPVAWSTQSAAGLVALRASSRLIKAPAAAAAWIDPIIHRAVAAGITTDLGSLLHKLIISRRAAPSPGIWRGAPEAIPGFIFNLPQFLDEALVFDTYGFGQAVEAAVLALSLANPGAQRLALGLADLALLLARLDLDYASTAATNLAATLAALIAAHADIASARLLARGIAPGYQIIQAPLPPARNHAPFADIHRAATIAQAEAAGLGLRQHSSLTGLLPPGPTEALLGVETVGIAAPLSALNGEGRLARWASARLAAANRSPEDALAATIAGDDPFSVADRAAQHAMHEAVAPFCALLPRNPWPVTTSPATHRVTRDKLPARRGGYTQKATIAGHKLFLRTGEYPDGRLGELTLTLPRESAVARSLAEALATAVSLALQHGVPLDDFVDEFAFLRAAGAGPVEGDASITQANSLIDYAFRHLAANYLGRADLATAINEDTQDQQTPANISPLLPLDLPETDTNRPKRQRPVLKLVS